MEKYQPHQSFTQGLFTRAYYTVKPLIPRRIQLALRRYVVRRKLPRVTHIWPIDPNSAKPPPGWTGWPDGKKFAIVLTHDVDKWRGHERCRKLMEIEKERGFISSFYFVAKRYEVSSELRDYLTENGFEVGIHGLYHDGKKFLSRRIFRKRVTEINRYLKEWNSRGFSSPSMLRNLDWIHDLDIDYDLSTFDTDPFEPQPEGVGTIFPFLVENKLNGASYVELPFTLPQDFTLFVLMKERNIDIWKKKLDWIVQQGGMALINVHPDYMDFDGKKRGLDQYPVRLYEDFLHYVKEQYENEYWNVLPRQLARSWRSLTPSSATPEVKSNITITKLA